MAGSSVSADSEELTLDNIRDGKFKLNVLKKVQLLELCNIFIGHIGRLELELEKNMAPHNVSTSNETFKLRAELKELKEAVFIDATGTNACGDVPVGLTQEFRDTGNRRVISWDTIHKLAAEQGGTNVEYNGTKRVVNAVVEREEVVEKEGEVEEAKFLKVKGRGRKTAKETATTTSGATSSGKLGATSSGKLDRRPVCPVMLAGDRCHGCAGYKHPPGCEDPTHGPRWSRPASCRLWHYGEGAKYRRGPISSSGGNPPHSQTKVLSNADLTRKNEKLKAHVARMELSNRQRNNKDKC
jgi:hypothetical protein